MNELVEGVLAVGSGFAPYHRSSRIGDALAAAVQVLPVGFHVHLLQKRGEAVQVLVVGQYGVRRGPEEVAVPNSECGHQPGNILAERGLGGMAVDALGSGQECAKSVCPNGNGEWKPDAAPHAVAASDPIPEPKRALGADAKGLNLGEVGT